MLVGFLVGMAVAWRLHAFGSIFDNNTEPLGLVIAAVLILGVGVIDDLREVSAPAKVSGIVLAASVLVLSGISILSLRIPFVSTFILDPNWSYLVSVIWVLGMTNAINIIDGLDGLAGGIVAIAAAAFFLYAQQLGHEGALQPGNIGPLIAVLVLGMCLGFLPYNVHPAKIFMGDGGALLLGLLMAASTMVVGGRTDTPVSGQTFFFFAPVFIPLVILGVPDPRHRLRHPASHPHAHQSGHRRQGPPAPSAHAAGPRSPAQRVHPVGLDGAAVGARAVPRLHPQGRRRGALRHRRAGSGPLHAAAPRRARGPPGRARRRGPGRRARRGRPGPPGRGGHGLAGGPHSRLPGS